MTHSFFLDIDPDVAKDPTAPYAVLPVPYEQTVTYGQGTAAGPDAILEASFQIEDFDEELRIPMGLRVQTLPSLDFVDLSEAQSIEKIRVAAESVVSSKRFLMAFGGEHTISVPIVTAVKSVYDRISVLQLDAHTDLRTQYDGTEFSHACVMRRIREMQVPTVHVGVRSISVEEYEYVQSEHVPIFWASEMQPPDTAWIDHVVDVLADPVYVTVDIDCLDPSLAPGTGTPEPGGPGWREATALLRKVFASRQVVAADIVETSPIPGSQVTQFTAARLAAKMLMYHKNRGAPQASSE